MKRVSIFGGVAIVALISFAMVHLSTKKQPRQPAATDGFAVVELFTSEGCSSCPAADEAVAKLLNEYQTNVYVLGFHVDYWNRLGWTDVYSSNKFSERQQQYSNALHSTVYTPQAIVNGNTEFTGSDNRKLHAAVDEGLATSGATTIQLSANNVNNKTVSVSWQLGTPSDNVLNIALVQSNAESDVRRGENSGKQLHHVNVVRAFTSLTPKATSGQVTLMLPEGLAAAGCRVIAYIQDAASWKIMGAASAGIK
jgi:hypothetical protein